MIDATGLEAVTPDGRTGARRWHCALLPLGMPSQGGVVVWHPDHVGVRGPDLPADARVPVDAAAAVVPLVLDLDGASVRLGRLEAAWIDGGVVHVCGRLEAVEPEDLAAAWLGEPLAAVAEFADVAHAADDAGGVDYFALTAWRLRRVRLERPGAPRWPSPVGVLRWLAPGDPDPRQ